MLLSLTVFQQSVSEAMPITSLQIPLLGNLVVKLYTKNTKEIGRYNNHLIVHSRQNLFSTLYCIYRFVNKKLYIYKQPLQTSSKKVRWVYRLVMIGWYLVSYTEIYQTKNMKSSCIRSWFKPISALIIIRHNNDEVVHQTKHPMSHTLGCNYNTN